MIQSDKIVLLDALPARLEPLRLQGKRIVHCHGVFDLLHPGHIRHLQDAKREGDVLVVTMRADAFVQRGSGHPVFPQAVRAEMLAALGMVDYVAVSEHPTAIPAIQAVRPTVFVKGGDQVREAAQEEEEAVRAVGGRLTFTQQVNGAVPWNAGALAKEHGGIYSDETRAFLKQFRERFPAAEVLRSLERIRPLRVLLIGDAVIDEYHYVRTLGKPSKANIIATQLLDQEAFAGGIFACANHAASFCDTVHVVTSLGRKETHEAFIRERLKPNVTMHAVYRDGMPTTVKRRFVDANFLSKLFEVYDFDDTPLTAKEQQGLHGHLRAVLPDYDVVIVLDYLHGLISSETIDLLTREAKFLAVNTQTNAANTGYNPITRYSRADYVCIDEPEMRLAMLDRAGDVETLLPAIADRLRASKMIGTRGHKGCITYEAGKGLSSVPVLSAKVVDAVGAGDAFLAVTAPCVAAGLPMELVGFIGNVVGSQAVLIVGNRESVERDALQRAIQTLLA